MEIEVTFPGGRRVAATVSGMEVLTDQSPEHGGEGSAPSPYEQFLASLAACTGSVVLGFCLRKNLPTRGLALTQSMDFTGRDKGRAPLAKVTTTITLPPGFPPEHAHKLKKLAARCSIKRAVLDPPEFETNIVTPEGEPL